MEKKILYTGGTFDLFHAGHVNFLRMCKMLSDEVVVSLNTDEFIKEYKGFTPFYSFKQRKEILLSCRYVDKVISNINGADSTVSIEKVQPHIIAIGTDWAKKDYYSQMGFSQEWLDIRNILLIYLPYTSDISSTLIKEKISKEYNK
jgi:glycerol-3-phosphate cytidylyltransferase